MAIEDYKITTEEVNEKHVEAQPDELTGTPDENKSVFDTLVEFVVEKLNGLIDFLAGNYISASQISGGLSTDVDNNVKWKYEIVKGESQGINFSGTVNYNTKTIIKSSPLPFLTLRNAIVKIGDVEYLMDDGVFATESYSEYDGKIRLSSDATNTYITILDEAFSTAIGTYLTITVYATSATTVPAKSLPLLVGEATGEFLQEQIDDINTNIGDMALSTVATDLTGAINETHDVPLDIQELYKPLIAPLSVSLTGFVEGSYLLYGEFYDDLRVFVKVSKTTAMSGTTAIGTLPSGYRPAALRTLPAYDTGGNVVSGITVTIGTDGAVSVVGNVDANVIVMAAYRSKLSLLNYGMITKNDIEKLLADNGLIFSLEEKIVGKWIDGKPLYQKTINFGSLPNNTTKDVAHGVSNMKLMVECRGVATSSSEIMPLPRVVVGSTDPKYSVSLSATTTYIRIISGYDRSSFSAYVTIRYTKTTD